VAKQTLQELFRHGECPPDDNRETHWVEEELAGCRFVDARLEKRFHRLLRKLAEGIGESIPFACQDWASTKAAYRFLANGKVGEHAILAGHFQFHCEVRQVMQGEMSGVSALFLPCYRTVAACTAQQPLAIGAFDNLDSQHFLRRS
jgi:Transposase DNA-binding